MDNAKRVVVGIGIVPQDTDPINPEGGDKFHASAAHATRNEGEYYYHATDAEWKGPLGEAAGGGGGSAAWLLSGLASPFSAGLTTEVVKYVKSTETASASSGTMPTGKISGYQTTYSTLAGYILSGRESGGIVTSQDKFTYIGETGSSIADTCNRLRQNACTLTFNGLGYMAGGNNVPGAGNHINTIQKFDTTPTESDSNLGTNLTSARTQLGQGGVNGSIGYFENGTNGGAGAVNQVDRFTVSGESIASLGTATAVRANSGGCYSTSKSYRLGGSDTSGTRQTSIYSRVFSTDTEATLGAVLSAARQKMTGTQDSNNGHILGGDEAGGEVDTIQLLQFSGESMSTSSNVLNQNKFDSAVVES
jgi:hypothetical protein